MRLNFSITVPRLPAGALSNLLGLLGLVAVVVAIGGLTSVWWAVLAAGVCATTLAVLAQLGDQAAVSATPAAAPAHLRPAQSPAEAQAS